MSDSTGAKNAGAEAEQRIDALAEDFLAELQAGSRPDTAGLLAAHADIAERLGRRLALVERLFRAGQAAVGADGRALPADQARRLKCPHCGNRIQLVEPRPKEVTCVNCGSSFRVEPETTATYRNTGPGGTIGRFQVRELLGRGAFGEVYKARDPELDRVVAVKIPRTETFGTREDEERFVREARSCARLVHPGIVQVHEVARAGDLPYIVSDYVEGLTLADLLTAGRPGFRDSAEILAQLADALDYAHRQGVVHRDVKPSNVLLSRSDEGTYQPHLTDFGLARRDEGEITITLDGQVLGTPAYMSPEQAAGDQRRVDGRSDVYSLGVVLYELLTGELPFRGNKRMLLHQVLNDEPRRPRTLNDHIPRDLENVCLKAMAKEPYRRYATAAEFADDLRRFSRREPVHARPMSIPYRLFRWSKRQPVVATLAALVLGVTTLGGTVSTYFGLSAQSNANAERLQRLAAERNTRTANSHRLALESRQANPTHPQRALLLAMEAIDVTRRDDEPVLPAAEQALRDALGLIGGTPIVRHDGPVNEAAIDPTGQWLATASDDSTVCLTDFRGNPGMPTKIVLHAHKTKVRFARFTPDGEKLITADAQGTILLWDMTKHDPSLQWVELHGHRDAILALAITSDSRWLATGSNDGAVRVWDLSSADPNDGAISLKPHKERVFAIGFNSDTTVLWTASGDDTVRIWQRGNCTIGNFSIIRELEEATGGATDAPLSPHGRWLPLGGANTLEVSLIDLDSGDFRRLDFPGQHADAARVAFTPDGRWCIVQSLTASVHLYDLAATNAPSTELVLRPGQVHLSSSLALATSGDSRYIVSATPDHGMSIWDLTSDEPSDSLVTISGHDGPIRAVAISPDSRRLVTGGADGVVRVWEFSDLRRHPLPIILMDHREHVAECAAISPDGRWAAAGANGCEGHLWDLAMSNPTAGHTRRESAQVEIGGHRTDACIAISGDSNWLFAASRNTGHLWNLARPAQAPFVIRDTVFSAAAISPDSKWLATGSGSGSGILWSLAKPDPMAAPVVLGKSGTPSRLVFSHDAALLVTAGGDNMARVWRVDDSGATMIATLVGHEHYVSAVAISPSDAMIATGSSDVRLWEAKGPAIGKSVRTLSGCSAHVLIISHDARWIIAGGWDGDIYIWDLESQSSHPSRILRGHGNVIKALDLSADDRILVSGSDDDTVRVWDLAAPAPTPTSIVLRGHYYRVNSVAITPDAHWVLSQGGAGELYLWTLRIDDLTETARNAAGRELTAAERERYQLPAEHEDTK